VNASIRLSSLSCLRVDDEMENFHLLDHYMIDNRKRKSIQSQLQRDDERFSRAFAPRRHLRSGAIHAEGIYAARKARKTMAPFRTLLDTTASDATILVRILVGAVFLSEGIQKFLFSAELGVGRFEKIGIPSPAIAAPFVGSIEVICGALLIGDC
jgi:hypothetical protein